MEDAAHVDPHIAEDIAARRWRAEREAEDEGRRRGEGGVARGAGRLLVEIDGIRLGGRMSEEFALDLFVVDLARIGGDDLEALVAHRTPLCPAAGGVADGCARPVDRKSGGGGRSGTG